MSDKRHFTVVLGNKEQGLFVGRSPSSVARKVVSKLSKGGKVTFQLREITQGSKKKVYGPYEGMKKKLKEPRKVGDRVYKYESVVKKIEKKGGGNNSENQIYKKIPSYKTSQNMKNYGINTNPNANMKSWINETIASINAGTANEDVVATVIDTYGNRMTNEQFNSLLRGIKSNNNKIQYRAMRNSVKGKSNSF